MVSRCNHKPVLVLLGFWLSVGSPDKQDSQGQTIIMDLLNDTKKKIFTKPKARSGSAYGSIDKD